MEPQAAQMPHMNTKDLAIFPSMSRRHTKLSRQRGGLSVLKEEEIWLAAKEVWDKFPNCKIARSYVLAHRIAKKVIEHEGDNTFLGSEKGLHCGVREDFDDTIDGVRRKDGRRIGAPPVTVLPEIFPFGRNAAAAREVQGEDDAPALVDEGGRGGRGGRGRGRGRGGRGRGRGCGGRGRGGGRGHGGRGRGGGGELVVDAGDELVADAADDPPDLIPEVTDPSRRHAIARAYALGLPPPPPLVE